MSRLKRYADLLVKVVEKGTEKLGDTSKDLSEKIGSEKKKVELRSQITTHERQISKAYEKLGEAYYEHEINGRKMVSLDDLVDVVKSNKKVIRLLEEQIEQLDKE